MKCLRPQTGLFDNFEDDFYCRLHMHKILYVSFNPAKCVLKYVKCDGGTIYMHFSPQNVFFREKQEVLTINSDGL